MKVGDKVEVVKFIKPEDMGGYTRKYINTLGVIINIEKETEHDEYPIKVEFENDQLNSLGYVYYAEEELSIVTNETSLDKKVKGLLELFESKVLPAVINNDEKFIELDNLINNFIKDTEIIQ